MPNYCSNTITIRGDKDTLDEFVKRVTVAPDKREADGQEYEILKSLYPTPQELVMVSGWSADETVQTEREKQYDANHAKYGSRDWYDWNCKHWGTKWGDCDTVLLQHTDKIVQFSTLTAWSPPLEGISTISKMFPTLEFCVVYDESNMGFFGVTAFDADGVIIDECRQYEQLDGYAELDFEADDYDDTYEKLCELVDNATQRILDDLGFGHREHQEVR